MCKKRTLLHLWMHRLLCPRVFLANLIHQCDQASFFYLLICVLKSIKWTIVKRKCRTYAWVLSNDSNSTSQWETRSTLEVILRGRGCRKVGFEKVKGKCMSHIRKLLANQLGTMECWAGIIWRIFFFHWGCVCVFADYVMWCFRTMASFSIQIPRAFAVCVNLLLFSRTWHLGYLFRWYLYLGPHDHIAKGSGAYCMADMVLGALLCQNLMGRVKRMSAFSFVSIDFTVWQ